jgi:hypothetical protein
VMSTWEAPAFNPSFIIDFPKAIIALTIWL